MAELNKEIQDLIRLGVDPTVAVLTVHNRRGVESEGEKVAKINRGSTCIQTIGMVIGISLFGMLLYFGLKGFVTVNTPSVSTTPSASQTISPTVNIPLFGMNSNLDVSFVTLQGFSICYQVPYSSATTVPILISACGSNPNAVVFVGSMQTAGSGTFHLGAFAKASDVFMRTTSLTTAYLHNGVYWYCVDGYGFGFADCSTINLYFADSTPGDYRLSWNTCTQYADCKPPGGYRSGSNLLLNSDSNWQKVIYIKN